MKNLKNELKTSTNILSTPFKYKIILIGSSTGGVTCLQKIVENLNPNLPPIIIIQHMPENYTANFAKRLNDISKLFVKEAEDGDILQINYIYIAKGGKHLTLDYFLDKDKMVKYKIKLSDIEKYNYIKPSIDITFISASNIFNQNILAILLTGMGKDGAEGLKIIKDRGGYTIIQDRDSAVVWGMPGHAYKIGAYHEILHIEDIADRIMELVNKDQTTI
ncbi:MAG: CheB methylesterase domain-containing protein [Spirochaetes bacterium]|nr:CheB methylesterase domain-containing protein [Spirochaetota bacterium]